MTARAINLDEPRAAARLTERLCDLAGNLRIIELAVDGAAHSPHDRTGDLEYLMSYVCETRRELETVAEQVCGLYVRQLKTKTAD